MKAPPGNLNYGTMPHSNILFTIVGATLLMNALRILGSFRSFCMASCSIGPLGCPFSCHNCSQLDCWYFWMTLSAILFMIGYC